MSAVTPKDWKDAIQVQDACNLSGVVRSLASVLERIWEDARTNGVGTDAVNTHPIVVLYCDKLRDLSTSHGATFENAYVAAIQRGE